MRKLLVFVFFLSLASLVGVAAQSTGTDPPKSAPHSAYQPNREIPKNCIQTEGADGSVLMTCDCEGCGHPEARDGMNPLPWSCVVRGEAVVCGYFGNPESHASSREPSRI